MHKIAMSASSLGVRVTDASVTNAIFFIERALYAKYGY